MKLSKKWTTVTTLSKTIALIMFIALPFIGFYFGARFVENQIGDNVVCKELLTPILSIFKFTSN